jgi:hypothetical protein
MKVKVIGIKVVRVKAEFPPLELLDSLCEQQAKKELEAMERKIEVVAPSKSLEAMLEIFKRKAKYLKESIA